MLLTRRVFRHAVMCYRSSVFPALLLAAMAAAHGAAPTALTVNNLSDSFGGNCAGACSLREAISNIAAGGTIDFAQDLLPGTIVLTVGQLNLTKSMRIQGPGASRLAISGNGLSRVLFVNAGSATIDIVGVTLRDGTVVGGNGADGTSGTGQDGKAGAGYGYDGGCIDVLAGSLLLEEVDIRNCVAQGGNGGAGGSGTAGSGLSAGGPGGKGGFGGGVLGGGIYFFTVDGDLTLRNSSLINCHALGGNGGSGGAGGAGFFQGPGGSGGHGGVTGAGAIFFAGANLSVYNTTIADSAAIGGPGGTGGTADAGDNAINPSGDGGDGGSAGFALFDIQDASVAHLAFATLANGLIAPGSGGDAGAGHLQGTHGQPGVAGTVAISAGANTIVLSTVIVGSGTPLCAGFLGAASGSVNLDEDSSCSGFTLHGSLAQTFRPLDPDTSRPAYMPVYHATVIDAAATCNDLASQPVVADQQGTPRPQGSNCDLGAIEADYIFVDGFD